MAYSEKLAERVRTTLANTRGLSEKKMFGGVCFLLNGNMVCGILNDDLIVRVGPQNYEASLKRANTRQFDITGKPMKSWVMVSSRGIKTNDQLTRWVEKGAAFAKTLPAK